MVEFKRPVRQFTLLTLFAATFHVALFSTFLQSSSTASFFELGVLASFSAGVLGHFAKGKPVLWAAIAGATWPLSAVLFAVGATVVQHRIVQGELYGEDGPGVYLYVATLVAIFSTLAGFIAGAIIGLVVHFGFRAAKVWQRAT